MAKKKKRSAKGFGDTSKASPPSITEKTDRNDVGATDMDPSANLSVAAGTIPGEQNAGQRALERMRKQRAEKKDDELRRVRELRSIDDFVRDDPGAAAIPEQVAMRMGNRMLLFVGIPLLGGLGSFVTFWYLATYKNYEFQPSLVAFTTIAILAIGLIGITYSVMSASWDTEREGSVLGTEEFGKNVKNIKEGLRRSRENAILRERMAGMPEEEIEQAIRDLDRREETSRRKKMRFNEELENDLE